ncbi:OmpA family protein [Ottowia sp.]|uniref:OmpA family protein n=1 Tax=Ottowia sp. TaxID=1898956 RepID=UPI003A835D43
MKLLATGLVATLLVAGCAPAARVTLLPQEGGKTGAVEVNANQKDTVLSQPYQSAAVGRSDVEIEQLDAKDVQKRYGTLLSVQPGGAERFTLYFMPGGTELTPESTSELAGILTHATERPGGELIITGHTDRVGKLEANDALSLWRAQTVRELVIGRGFNASRVDAVGRGEREPVVPTEDEVDEPKNRRVEIVVR